MIKAASRCFPTRVYVCLPVRSYFVSSPHSTVSYLSGFPFFLSALPFWAGVSEFLSMSVLYLGWPLALSLCLFKKEGERR